MTFRTFLAQNASWLAGAVTLTLFSSAGQTYFIGLFSADIRHEFQLSHGEFGGIYMVATLASAVSLVVIGKIADVFSPAWLSRGVIVTLALTTWLMASVQSLWTLVLAIYLLRLLGQGMMTHVAVTAISRWFAATRGRALAITGMGYQLGEGLMPLAMVSLLAVISWRDVWLLLGGCLLLIALPIVWLCFAEARQPREQHAATDRTAARHWSRREALADPRFWLICIAVLTPAFIGTSMFFHQLHIGRIKGWEPLVIASAFPVLAGTNVVCGLLSGYLVDRFSARRLLPVAFIPLALGCHMLAVAEHAASVWVFMACLGLAGGFSNTTISAIWPEIYGTQHLGAIRSVVFAVMVFASALGPGVTGALIDAGIGFEGQLEVMAIYCVLIALALVPLSQHLCRQQLVN